MGNAVVQRGDWELLREMGTAHPSPVASHPVFGSLAFNELSYPDARIGGSDMMKAIDQDADSDTLYVVTGASAGIGLAVARSLTSIFRNLGKRGNVVWAVRNESKVTKMEGFAGSHEVRLDLADMQ